MTLFYLIVKISVLRQMLPSDGYYTRVMCVLLGNRVPRDKTVLVSRRKKISAVAFTCVSSVSAVGLILASAFLSYNLYHRKLR